MILTLLANEWRGLLRDGRAAMLLALGAVLAIASTWTAASTDARERLAQVAATGDAREAWMERDLDNPHQRAHFGDFVFRPSGPLAGLDSGLQMVTGRAVRLEAHRQNDAVHVPHKEASSLLRFDRLEPSTVLNLLVPLVLILAGFGTVASERESGRLRLLRIQGASPLTLLLAKALSLWSIGVLLNLLVVGTHLLFAQEAAAFGPTVAYFSVHFLALWIVSVLVACVSSWCSRPGTAAGVLLGLWVASAIALPRLTALAANAAIPLPSRDAFDAAMQEDREKGLDGHNPSDVRRLQVEESVLAEYGVSTKEELPVNLDGFLMQADEEYGNKVWDQHFGQLEQLMRRQSGLVGSLSFVNPLQAADRISMSIAGTGLDSHLAFLDQVESHRRSLVQRLNDEHALGGSKTGDWGWKPELEFYESFATFRFEPPSLGQALARCRAEWGALLVWAIGLTGLLFYSARRLERGGSL